MTSTEAMPFHTQLAAEIAGLAELLPLQGPITAFAFLNPLQGMEDRPFVNALRDVSSVYDCEPFLSETRYRNKMQRGRITVEELREFLLEEPDNRIDEMIGGLVRRIDLRLSMLQHPVTPANENELRWMVAESDALRRFRPEMTHESRDRLLEETRHWMMCDLRQPPASSETHTADPATSASCPKCFQDIVQKVMTEFDRGSIESWSDSIWEQACLSLLWKLSLCRLQTTPAPTRPVHREVRHRDLLLDVTSEDTDLLVHPVLVRFCAAFLDQGYAQWSLPDREDGFLKCFCRLFEAGVAGTARWMRPLTVELQKIQANSISALASVEESLKILGVQSEERNEYLRNSLLALRGWAGMIWQTETRPDRVYRSSLPGTLNEFLAVRLLLDRLAIADVAKRTIAFIGTLSELRPLLRQSLHLSPEHNTDEQRAFLILQLAQIHGWCPKVLAGMSEEKWRELIQEVDAFGDFERRRIFHFAFERQLLHRVLDAVSIRAAQPLVKPAQPQLQIVTCIDAREESFRRHLEEVAPDVETFGNAGFFCVPMYYRGAGEATFTALCPVVIRPQNWIVEDVVYALEESHRQRAVARRWIGTASHQFDFGTRSSVSGAVLTALIGPLATVPLLGRILFPRFTAQMHKTARRFVAPPSITRLRLEREEGTPAGPTDEGIGFTLSEMVSRSERSLRDIGLTSNFARMVMFLGHG
ncbi:MAG: putative inorganic carbon transporter subunit DabA, partial [Planctomycetota bacterium]